MLYLHIRNAAFQNEISNPDGMIETLFDIPGYVLHWDFRCDCKQPRLIPRGSTMKITAIFKNSVSNRANRDSTKASLMGQ